MDSLNLEKGGCPPIFLPISSEALADVEMGARQWYFTLINLEASYPLLQPIWKRTVDTLAGTGEVSRDNLAFALLLTPQDRSFSAWTPDTLESASAAKERWSYLYSQYGPLFKIMGAWLTGVTSIGNAWTADGSILVRAHARMVGMGQRPDSQAFLFEQAANAEGIVFAPVFTARFAYQPSIEEYSFELPNFLLAISRFPCELYPQTLGVNLAMSAYVDALNLLLRRGAPLFGKSECPAYSPLAVEAIEIYLAVSSEKSTQRRIANGYHAAMRLIESFEVRLATELADDGRFGARADMVALIKRLGSAGHGYHKRGKLAGVPIDEWLRTDKFSAEATTAALARSRYVLPGRPDKSVFLRIISDPRGPMFGVFRQPDIDVVRAWILQLRPDSTDAEETAAYPRPHARAKSDRLCMKSLNKGIAASLAKYANCSLKDLYPLFLHADKNPDVIPTARRFATKWLARHRRHVACSGLPFSPYSHERLEMWLETSHSRQVASYRPLIGVPEESRDEIIEDAIRLAPLTLIDGAWLRNFSAPGIVTSHCGSLLYRTLADELGQGEISGHHGNIYLALLKSMDIELDRFTDKNFAASTRFDDSCLRVPVFWLAISLFPQSLFPEILGLNLAMELSGIGGEYRRSGDVLRYFGYSSWFTDLHNTIDNVVTGHTAWACDAIRHHLDSVLQTGGEQARQEHWARIWTGYRSLSPPPNGPFVALTDLARFLPWNLKNR